MIDADHDIAIHCLLDELGAFLHGGRHRLFEEDVDPMFDQFRRRAGVEIGRKEDVNHVEASSASSSIASSDS